ncbi:large subunit GTPase 1 homolog isoform X1 [Ornithorhynchus anatinus]|uniref:Large subunit GTPase 1 homolog n=1 Tax=Ornithorhynchus anatinus TaxID=9258 RepID=F6V2N8_ORNAN|nr:large subunit GTPase 1 homolog isoform X1 [Ornithorhynchus anatinus]
MGKKKGGGSGLGRSLLKERGLRRRDRAHTQSWLHTSELNDGYDWGRLNLQSVTEQTALDEFLATAELARTEFVAEKLNIKFVPAEARTGLLSSEESLKIKKLHEENKQFLCIPRRPYWDKRTSAEKLQQAERENFLAWRRQLVRLEEEQKLILTPFERNLDFWRQLWRVIERSDVVVQIVDARNPLLFRCEDLERYVKEIDEDKENVILINKADLLTEGQRSAWARFFEQEGVKIVFWSALAESLRLNAEAKGQGLGAAEELDELGDGNCSQEEDFQPGVESTANSEEEASEYEDCEESNDDWQTCSEDDSGHEEKSFGQKQETGGTDSAGDQSPKALQNHPVQNFSRLVQKHELLEIFKTLHTGKKFKEGELTVGLVGYPNVGKSSTINTIIGNKKVSVSATPGHTKHFQTLYVEPGLCLCDCPGLVMPSFVSTKAEMICCGILPIDQLRDHVPSISLICQNIPRQVLEATYGINIIRPGEDEDPDRKPTSEELLTAYGYMRGFMTSHGQPDQPRSARYLLKDYVSGKLLYCHPPPGIDPVDFQPQHQHIRLAKNRSRQGQVEMQPERNQKAKQIENVVDRTFFHQENVQALMKGVRNVMGYRPGSGMVPAATVDADRGGGKPWKKHGNRNKKEKIRRINKHLDA